MSEPRNPLITQAVAEAEHLGLLTPNPTFCAHCGHLNASHGTRRKRCLACRTPVNGGPGRDCPDTIEGRVLPPGEGREQVTPDA